SDVNTVIPIFLKINKNLHIGIYKRIKNIIRSLVHQLITEFF
ncbi:hypothetical protein LCGC14_2113430, partial [marine sediment metagenome]